MYLLYSEEKEGRGLQSHEGRNSREPVVVEQVLLVSVK